MTGNVNFVSGSGGGGWPGGQSGAGSTPVGESGIVRPVAINADTMYGTSIQNFGMGSGFQSQQTMQTNAAVVSNAPSIWWLLIALAAVALLT